MPMTFVGVVFIVMATCVNALGADTAYVVFDHNTLKPMPSDYVPKRTTSIDTLTCALARGEYNAVQFGVHAVGGDLANVRISVTGDLGVTTYHRRTKFIAQAVPEPTAADLDKTVAHPSDAMYLQRGDTVSRIARGVSVNFWLTIHAPPGADVRPGEHRGKVRIDVDGQPATELELVVDVRPFELAPARIPFGMYYARGQYTKGHDASHEWIYRDMAEHSQNSVTFSVARNFGSADFKQVPFKDDHPMVKIINTARDVGLVSAHHACFLVSSFLYNETREKHAKLRLNESQMKAAIAWLTQQRAEQNWPEIMQYTWDEPPVPAPGMREWNAPMRKLPFRSGTAMSAKAAYAHGDFLDVWVVHDGHITPELQAEAKRRGAEVWTYTYRLWRQSYEPLIQRHYAGLYTWALKLKGNLVWEYYYGYNWADTDSN